MNTALWGGITTICARLKGIEAVVIDGAVRDVAEIERQALPVFARAAVPRAAATGRMPSLVDTHSKLRVWPALQAGREEAVALV